MPVDSQRNSGENLNKKIGCALGRGSASTSSRGAVGEVDAAAAHVEVVFRPQPATTTGFTIVAAPGHLHLALTLDECRAVDGDARRLKGLHGHDAEPAVQPEASVDVDRRPQAEGGGGSWVIGEDRTSTALCRRSAQAYAGADLAGSLEDQRLVDLQAGGRDGRACSFQGKTPKHPEKSSHLRYKPADVPATAPSKPRKARPRARGAS